MTKLPKIERCVCGRVAYWHLYQVRCTGPRCLRGFPDGDRPCDAILAWNAVMRAAKAAELTKRAARRHVQAKAAKKGKTTK